MQYAKSLWDCDWGKEGVRCRSSVKHGGGERGAGCWMVWTLIFSVVRLQLREAKPTGRTVEQHPEATLLPHTKDQSRQL